MRIYSSENSHTTVCIVEHKHGIYSWWLPEGRIISSARAVTSQYSSESWSSTGMGVWIGAKLVVTDPVSFVSPVLISCFLVQTTPFGCLSPKIAHFRMLVSNFWLLFPSNLDCISKLLRQYCQPDFNNWNNYSNFNLCFLHIYGIRGKEVLFLCHASAFYFSLFSAIYSKILVL